MKKFVVILVAVCVIFAAVIGVVTYRNGERNAKPEPTEVTEPEDVVTDQVEAPEGLDFAALRAAHADDEVVMTVDGADVTWSEYFYWVAYNADMIQNYVGTVEDWNAELMDGKSYAEFIREAAESSCVQYHSMETMAAANGLSLDDNDLAELAAQREYDMTNYCGENATEEDFAAYLAERNMTVEMYDYITRTYQLYNSGFAKLYGENGENCTAEDILAYLNDNEYMNANHILFMTIDPATGAALDEQAAADKLAQAEALVEELRAIEDPEELVARFRELKEEFCEDTGKVQFPDGYVFMPGTMVAEFENGVLALADYEVSEPIKSGYGYHIILRLPLSLVTADTVIEPQYGYNAAYVAAANAYSAMGQSYFDNAIVEYMPAFESFTIADIA